MKLRRLVPIPVRAAYRSAERKLRIPARSWRFWPKTAVYRLMPGGWGYYRKLRAQRDPSYDHPRHMHPVRRKHYGAEGWRPQTVDGLHFRDYENYDEYVVHQRQKFDEMLKFGVFFESNQNVSVARRRFHRRFRHLVPLLPRDAVIVCAGARQGTEVEVLRDLGFRAAYGIDLNPGPGNPLVRSGDFHQLDNPTGSVDLIYSNSVDHAFDLDLLFTEHARAIRPDGYVLYDLPLGYAPGQPAAAESIVWERDRVPLVLMLEHFETVVRVESEPGFRWILLQGKRVAGSGPAGADQGLERSG